MIYTTWNIATIFVLALPVACIAWTVTHEEIFRELRDYSERKSTTASSRYIRKFFYIFTCEYCFSHYVALLLIVVTHYKLLFEDWRGYVLAYFSVIWIANLYMSLYGRLRIDIKTTHLDKEIKETKLEDKKKST
jgi:hypothetical protein